MELQMAKLRNKYPVNANIDFEVLLDYTALATPFDHQEDCAYGQNDGNNGKIRECHCSRSHVKEFLKLQKERNG
jgi:hypothetical protein